MLRLSSCLVEFDINLLSSCGCNKITGLKYKCMSKSSFPKKTNSFYKSLLTSKLNFSKLCEKNKKKKMDPYFLKGFFYEKTYISDMGISCVQTSLETTSGLEQNQTVPVIPLLSRLFQQVVTPLLERNYFFFTFLKFA